MATEGSTIALITLAVIDVVQFIAVVLLWLRFNSLPSIRDIDLNEKMQRVLDIATQDSAIRNESIRKNLRNLLDSIDKDPLAAEKFFVQCHSLRNLLNK